jgi:hypothetical protein
MKQEKKEVSYISFGEKYTPTEDRKKHRAFAYTLAATALNDVGAGSDDNILQIRSIMAAIKTLCYDETGYIIDDYNTKLVGCNHTGWKKNPYE